MPQGGCRIVATAPGQSMTMVQPRGPNVDVPFVEVYFAKVLVFTDAIPADVGKMFQLK
jgi:hypothetical protein